MLLQQARARFFALLGNCVGLAKCNLATATALHFYSQTVYESIIAGCEVTYR